MWLEAPVDETDDQGRTRRTTRNKDSKRGMAGVNYFFRRVASRGLVTGLPQQECYRAILESVLSYR
jgi:hypothetical protein